MENTGSQVRTIDLTEIAWSIIALGMFLYMAWVSYSTNNPPALAASLYGLVTAMVLGFSLHHTKKNNRKLQEDFVNAVVHVKKMQEDLDRVMIEWEQCERSRAAELKEFGRGQ